MNFDKVPDIPPELTQNVTVDAYTRYVDVEGQRIAQLVLSGVHKGERAEALKTENFYVQFQIEEPALDSTKEVIVEGDHAELLEALKRLVVEEEGEDTTNTAESNEHNNVGGDENVGSNNGGNEDAAHRARIGWTWMHVSQRLNTSFTTLGRAVSASLLKTV